MIKRNQKVFNAGQILLDAIIVCVAFALAYYLRFESGLFVEEWHLTLLEYIQSLVVALPALLVIFYIRGLYDSARKKTLIREIGDITFSTLILALLILSLLFVVKQIHISREFIVFFFLFVVLFISLERSALRIWLRHIRSRGYNAKYVLIVGGGELGRSYIDEIQALPYLGYHAIGFLDDDPGKQETEYKSVPVIGKLDALEDVLTMHPLDEVIIALPLQAYDRLSQIIGDCEKHGVKSMIIPDYLRYVPARPDFDELGDLYLINTRYVPLDNILNQIVKRIFDIVVSLIAIVVMSPVMLVSAVLIKCGSPGPVILKQRRVGYNRKEFIIYKFRTMLHQPEHQSDTKWTTTDDKRRTRIGAFLRRTSLDELPNLFNILIGDMSVVGPRPERPYFVEQFREKIPKYMVKHQVRPGLTGWAQVHGWRGDTSISERIRHDIYYIENWSLMLDIRIMLMTFFKGFINKNAY